MKISILVRGRTLLGRTARLAGRPDPILDESAKKFSAGVPIGIDRLIGLLEEVPGIIADDFPEPVGF